MADSSMPPFVINKFMVLKDFVIIVGIEGI